MSTDAAIDLEALYRDLHANPELGFAEHRTAAIIDTYMSALGLEVTTGVGGTGVVAILRNGSGPVVHLRADMDALPVREETGLAYASVAVSVDAAGASTPLMHACGHDMHVTCLVGAVEQLVARRLEWAGTVVAVFQPAEETIAGAKAMVADGYGTRFPRPDVVLGQHVAPLPAGVVAIRPGPTLASTDSIEIVFTGQGGHGSRPQSTIDPIVTAAASVLRLQTIVSREVEPGLLAVVTVGTFHAGTKSNIIPATATIQLNVRTVDAQSRARILGAIERIVKAEAAAAGMTIEPTLRTIESGPATVNDDAATDRASAGFVREFGEGRVIDIGVTSGSEDVGQLALATDAPLVFWFFGGIDAAIYGEAVAAGSVERDIPGNHSPHFAPVIQPTVGAGVENLTVAALEFLRSTS